MPTTVTSIGDRRRATWSLLEVSRPGHRNVPLGILLVDHESGNLTLRLRDLACFEELEEQELDMLTELDEDLRKKAGEMGALRLVESLEDSLSGFLRISDRTVIALAGDPERVVNRLFDQHVDAAVRPYVTHLPLYSLRAAATKFGEAMASEEEGWIRVPANLRLVEGMFVARVVGRSMEPLIPDGSLCIFRFPVTGSRNGRRLLIEKFGETDFSARYTVKRYVRPVRPRDESAERSGPVRLEPLNPEFEPFDLETDEFRVIAEFVRILP